MEFSLGVFGAGERVDAVDLAAVEERGEVGLVEGDEFDEQCFHDFMFNFFNLTL